MIIGISGKIGSGKDTVGRIIQYLTSKRTYHKSFIEWENISKTDNRYYAGYSDWQIKKYAGKLKQTVSILTGIPVEDLEKQEVKDRVLGEEWARVITVLPLSSDVNKIIIERGYTNTFFEQTDKSFIVYQKITVKQLLQEVGTDAMPNVIHPNIWVNALFTDYKSKFADKEGFTTYDKIEDAQGNDTGITVKLKDNPLFEPTHFPNWIITDCRFPNELQAVKDRGGITIRINIEKQCGSCENTFTCSGDCPHCGSGNWVYGLIDNTHPSETALDDANFKYTIDNNGSIEELIQKVKDILIKEKLI